MDEYETIDYLILNGGLDFKGFDPISQEPLYSFTPKIKDLMPQLYEEHMNSINHEVMTLWEKGYLNLDLMAKEPLISLSEKSFDQNAIESLPSTERHSLEEIKRVLLDKNF